MRVWLYLLVGCTLVQLTVASTFCSPSTSDPRCLLKEDVTALLQVKTQVTTRTRPSTRPILEATATLEEELASDVLFDPRIGRVQPVEEIADVPFRLFDEGVSAGLASGGAHASRREIGQVEGLADVIPGMPIPGSNKKPGSLSKEMSDYSVHLPKRAIGQVNADITYADAKLEALSHRLSATSPLIQAIPSEDAPPLAREEASRRAGAQVGGAVQGGVLVASNDSSASVRTGYASNLTKQTSTVTETYRTGEERGLIAACAICTILIIGGLCFFGKFRQKYPDVYAKRGLGNAGSLFGWTDQSGDVEQDAGLDQAMLVRFIFMSFRLFILIGLPVVLIFAWLNRTYGGGRAGENHLDKASIRNIEEGKWLWWVHGGFAWYVVAVSQYLIITENRTFIQKRKKWLEQMPPPQSTTALIENIPEDYRTDANLTNLLNNAFGSNVVQQASVIKDTRHLIPYVDSLNKAQRHLEDDEFALSQGVRPTVKTPQGQVDAITYRKEQIDNMKRNANKEREAISKYANNKNVKESSKVCKSRAFVTFKSRKDAAEAQEKIKASAANKMTASPPPDPSDVIYSDLTVEPDRQWAITALGFLLLVLLFMVYGAVVGCLAKIDRAGSVINDETSLLAAIYNGVFHSTVLIACLSFYPFFLSSIFGMCWVMKSGARVQSYIQTWYFFGQVLLVLNITASLVDVNFFLKFVLMELVFVVCFDFTRLAVLQRYHHHVHRQSAQGKSRKEAELLAEPEDQDFYGIGARNARFALVYTTALLFCQLCPFVLVIAIAFFGLCYMMYPYLFVFAETRKLDSGGIFWVNMMSYIQFGCFLYVVVLASYIYHYGQATGPTIVAACSLFLLLASVIYWHWSLRPSATLSGWQSEFYNCEAGRSASRLTYEQPELMADPTGAGKGGSALDLTGCVGDINRRVQDTLNSLNCSKPASSAKYNSVPPSLQSAHSSASH